MSGDRQQPTDKDIDALYHNVCPPQSAGGVFDSDSATELSNSVFIVNGLSSLGACVAHRLGTNSQWEVLSIAPVRDRSCGDKLMWYRQDILRENGISNIFIDWSESNTVELLLKIHRPGHVIIIPPGVDGGSRYILDSTMWAGALHDFVALLEAVKNISPASRLTLVSVSKSVRNELEVVPPSGEHISLLETLVGAFELSVSTYHTLYHIPFSVLRLKGVYGPWTHHGLDSTTTEAAGSGVSVGCYIDDIVKAVHSSLSLNSKCIVVDCGSCEHDTSRHQKYALEKLGMTQLTSPDEGRRLTERWRNVYHHKISTNLILTSYFSGNGVAKKFKNLQSWLESVSSHKLDATVLHDGLDNGFITRSKQHYSRLSFELFSVPRDFGRNSTCTQSVRAFADYLEYRTDIERVIIMDLSRTVKRNAFPAMEVLGDWLYSDVDVIPFRDILSPANSQEDDSTVSLASSMVLGGSRHLVLATLNKITQCLENRNGTSVLQCIMDRWFVQHAFLGWPLSMAIGG